MDRRCKECEGLLVRRGNERTKVWTARVFCSKTCANRFNRNKPWLGKKRPAMTGKNHFAWLGDNVGIAALHDWVKSRLGQPSKCEHCGTRTAKRYEWANKSRKYKRELSDWIRLCTSCHRLYDGHGFKAWETRRLEAKSIYQSY